MRLLPVSLLALVLVTGRDAAAQPPLPETGLRRIDLRAGAAGTEPELHIRAGVSTVLTFDKKLARDSSGRFQVELERASSFTRADSGEFVLLLVPSDALKSGDTVRLTVRFEDGEAPQMATFGLVVSRDRADRLVEVLCEPRPVESCPRELQEARAAVLQCQEALDRAQTAPGGLTALRVSGALADRGVVARNLSDVAVRGRQGAFVTKQLRTYRAARRVLVELLLRAQEPGAPWTARNASLAGPGGELLKILSVWQASPVTSDAPERILVEAEADRFLSPESWTLWLSEDGGGRALVLGGVVFAPME
ncbi:DUF2381 family protein [Pyxidicoccus xibeiensis]|uniref:DUF2381 family protein n=1 Tax=Pyxidicoccus xibeiensis TaxID=2906759 RepID=UPI0020A739C5|nr:DUF2381 family protein [Pyxidicoccus xibeiensis]MCP3142114.1 DUF2381 family protein [Pyxidicoccus xibeiensis]